MFSCKHVAIIRSLNRSNNIDTKITSLFDNDVRHSSSHPEFRGSNQAMNTLEKE
ncbi:hypothetical protein NPIL_34281, partial [Nephila pilipes]